MSFVFGKSQTEISYVIKLVSAFIWREHRHILTDLGKWEPYFAHFAERVHAKTGRLANCIGFVDGKLWQTCAPVRHERRWFNGHKRHHGLKNQSVTFPNGMLGHYWGPMNGNRHDAHMLRCSGLVSALRACNMHLQVHPSYCVYGDPAYPLSEVVQAPHKGVLRPFRV